MSIWSLDRSMGNRHPYRFHSVLQAEAAAKSASNADRLRLLLCSLLAEMNAPHEVGVTDFSAQFYLPFFSQLLRSEHAEAFTHFILQSKSVDSAHWVDENRESVSRMFDFLDAVN